MSKAVLVILFAGREILAVHEDEAAAWDALLRFVDDHWRECFADAPAPVDGTERVRQFFTGARTYLVARASSIDIPAAGSTPAQIATPRPVDVDQAQDRSAGAQP